MLINTLNVANNQYRYLATMSRLSGANGKYQRTDAGESQVFVQESAANKAPDNVDTDYAEYYGVNAIGSEYKTRQGKDKINGQQVELFAPKNTEDELTGRLWTHYSLYRTEDLLDEEVDQGTAPETYIWAADIPMVKQFVVSGIFDSIMYLSFGNTFDVSDAGAVITTTHGESYIIIDILSSTKALVTNADNSEVTGSVIFRYAHIGGGNQMCMTRIKVDDNTAEYTIIEGYDPIDSDVGNEIIFANGELCIIKYRIISDGVVTVGVFEVSGAPAASFKPTGGTTLLGVLSPTSRVFTDTVTDDTLRARKESGEPLYFLETRFFSALPNGKLSAIAGGAYFTTSYKKSELYYCSLRNLYRAGYYHPGFQYNDKPIGSITRLKEYPNSLAIFGKNFTYYLDPTITLDAGENRVGEFIPVFTDPRLITNKIGIVTEGNAADIDTGGEVLLTAEPAVRTFDGYTFSDNLADDSIQNSRIAAFYHAVVMTWNKRRGLKIVGVVE